MKLTLQAVVVGTELRKGKKDASKEYPMIVLVQGAETITTIVEDLTAFEVAKNNLYKPVICEVVYSDTYKSVKVSAVQALPKTN